MISPLYSDTRNDRICINAIVDTIGEITCICHLQGLRVIEQRIAKNVYFYSFDLITCRIIYLKTSFGSFVVFMESFSKNIRRLFLTNKISLEVSLIIYKCTDRILPGIESTMRTQRNTIINARCMVMVVIRESNRLKSATRQCLLEEREFQWDLLKLNRGKCCVAIRVSIA